ncbi:MAG: caspase family protein [Microcoleaceae cyanobacterium]
MRLTRRSFLQRTGLWLGALGVSEVGWWQLGDRYAQVLAQPTQRKLALLVGINQYPAGKDCFEPLRGCITDVELQRELLQARFGFQSADILTLTDTQATRENIETAFITHLTEQAQAEDIVVFHFSGYGCCVLRPHDSSVVGVPPTQNALVPADGHFLASEDNLVNGILEDTLWLLLRSLRTPWVITVLDTSYTYPSFSHPGTLRIRSSAHSTGFQPDPKELAFQEHLLSQANLFLNQLEDPGIPQSASLLFTAAKPSQIAAEITREGFSAGLFTYSLTQALWSATPSITLTTPMRQAAAQVEQLMGTAQQPQLYYQHDSLQKIESALGQILKTVPVADGIVQSVDNGNKTAKVWLAGLSPPFLDGYGINSVLAVLPNHPGPNNQPRQNPVQPQLLVRSQTGLVAKATLRTLGTDNLTPLLHKGQLVQEAIRVLPRQVSLKVGLDPDLARIERVDATSAFSGITQVTVVSGEQPAEYLLGRVQDTAIAQSPNAPLPALSPGRYGLFSLGQVLIPETLGERGETVKVAVQRLTPQLKIRLAVKLLHLTVNERSLVLKTRVTFALLAPQSRVLMQQETPQDRANSQPLDLIEETKDQQPQETEQLPKSKNEKLEKPETQALVSPFQSSTSQGIVTTPVGSRIQYQIQNNGSLPLFFILFQLDSRGRAYLLDPTLTPAIKTDAIKTENLEAQPAQQQVAPGKTLSLPTASAYAGSGSAGIPGEIVQGPEGLAETYVVLSHAPFTRTLQAIAPETKKDGGMLKVLPLSNPLAVTEAVLQDLNRASQPGVERAGVSTDDIALDINAWATFNFVYRVIEKV